MDPNLEIVAPVAPEATAPSVTPIVAPEVTPPAVSPAAPEAGPVVGTKDNPVVVPFGTEAKFKELAEGGWKQEDIDAYLTSIPDEALRAQIKDGIDGKLHLADGDAPEDVIANPFTPEELAELDPIAAARINFIQDQLLEQMEAVEKARGELPDPMKRLLMDPVVKARLAAVEKGESFVPEMLHTENIMGVAQSFVESNDIAGLQDLLKTVLEAVPEVILQQHANTLQEFEQREQAKAENDRVVNYISYGLQRLEAKPEFQSNKPAVIETANGPMLNPEHPGGAFTLWLEAAMKDGLTLPVIDKMGGLEGLAYTWLANQKGGFGQIVKGAVDKSNETLREKLMRSKASALRASAAPTLSVATGGVVKSLLHGIDIDLAIKDPDGYAARVDVSKLTDAQLSEVSAAIKRKASGR